MIWLAQATDRIQNAMIFTWLLHSRIKFVMSVDENDFNESFIRSVQLLTSEDRKLVD